MWAAYKILRNRNQPAVNSRLLFPKWGGICQSHNQQTCAGLQWGTDPAVVLNHQIIGLQLFSVQELEAKLCSHCYATAGWHNIAVLWFAPRFFVFVFSFVIVLVFVLTEWSAIVLVFVFVTKIALVGAHTRVHVGGPHHLCGRGGCHLSFLTSAAWRTGHWSWTDGLTIARISCCCGSHVIHADSEVISVISDYTCCAERLMLNLKGGHKRRIASGSLDQWPLCNSNVKWSSLVGVQRSEQSCLLIGLPTARSHQLANTGR